MNSLVHQGERHTATLDQESPSKPSFQIGVLCVTVATADGGVDSHTLGTVVPLNPYGMILQHTGTHCSTRQHTKQHAFEHKQRHAANARLASLIYNTPLRLLKDSHS